MQCGFPAGSATNSPNNGWATHLNTLAWMCNSAQCMHHTCALKTSHNEICLQHEGWQHSFIDLFIWNRDHGIFQDGHVYTNPISNSIWVSNTTESDYWNVQLSSLSASNNRFFALCHHKKASCLQYSSSLTADCVAHVIINNKFWFQLIWLNLIVRVYFEPQKIYLTGTEILGRHP